MVEYDVSTGICNESSIIIDFMSIGNHTYKFIAFSI